MVRTGLAKPHPGRLIIRHMARYGQGLMKNSAIRLKFTRGIFCEAGFVRPKTRPLCDSERGEPSKWRYQGMPGHTHWKDTVKKTKQASRTLENGADIARVFPSTDIFFQQIMIKPFKFTPAV